jgi:signal recognition particle GTPase
LIDRIADEFVTGNDVFSESPVTILMVGVNGTGKTTSVGKLAKAAVDQGRSVMLGSADTFRAAAAEQLDVWAQRAQVPVIRRERGADPAAVAFDSVVAAESERISRLSTRLVDFTPPCDAELRSTESPRTAARPVRTVRSWTRQQGKTVLRRPGN